MKTTRGDQDRIPFPTKLADINASGIFRRLACARSKEDQAFKANMDVRVLTTLYPLTKFSHSAAHQSGRRTSHAL